MTTINPGFSGTAPTIPSMTLPNYGQPAKAPEPVTIAPEPAAIAPAALTPNIIINNSSNAEATATAIAGAGLVRTKSALMAIILTCLGFAGIAGLQWFYLGRPLRGLVYLLTLGFFGVGTVIDLFTVSAVARRTL